jgi:hypothetical protein
MKSTTCWKGATPPEMGDVCIIFQRPQPATHNMQNQSLTGFVKKSTV